MTEMTEEATPPETEGTTPPEVDPDLAAQPDAETLPLAEDPDPAGPPDPDVDMPSDEDLDPAGPPAGGISGATTGLKRTADEANAAGQDDADDDEADEDEAEASADDEDGPGAAKRPRLGGEGPLDQQLSDAPDDGASEDGSFPGQSRDFPDDGSGDLEQDQSDGGSEDAVDDNFDDQGYPLDTFTLDGDDHGPNDLTRYRARDNGGAYSRVLYKIEDRYYEQAAPGDSSASDMVFEDAPLSLKLADMSEYGVRTEGTYRYQIPESSSIRDIVFIDPADIEPGRTPVPAQLNSVRSGIQLRQALPPMDLYRLPPGENSSAGYRYGIGNGVHRLTAANELGLEFLPAIVG